MREGLKFNRLVVLFDSVREVGAQSYEFSHGGTHVVIPEDLSHLLLVFPVVAPGSEPTGEPGSMHHRWLLRDMTRNYLFTNGRPPIHSSVLARLTRVRVYHERRLVYGLEI